MVPQVHAELEMSGWSGFPTLVNDPHGLLQGLPLARIATVLCTGHRRLGVGHQP